MLIDKYTELPYCPLKGQSNQVFGMGKSKGGRAAGHAGGSPQNRNASNIRAGGHHFDTRNLNNGSRNMGDTHSGMFRQSFAGHESSFHSAAPHYHGGHHNRPPYPKSNYHHHEENDFDYLYNQEQDQMNREIAELLEGRKNLENIGPSEASSNLRQVLKGLEGVKKKVKALGEAEDNEDDHHDPKPDLEKMTSTIIGAFDKAQKKTAKKAIGYALAKEKEASAMYEVGTMPDNDMLEAYKRQIRFEVETQLNQKSDELTILKKKFALLESDRNELHDKYSKVTVEHSRCEQVERELKLKLLQAEKELKALKDIIEDVKKGKVEKLNLSKEQQNTLKKSIQSPNSTAEVSEELMQKLQETRKEMKILKYQLENNGKKPPVGQFDNDNEDIELASGRVINPSKALKKNNNNAIDIGNVQAVEIEEKVMVNGKLVTQKKTVYKQLQKKVVTNSNGEKVEVEELVDVDANDVKVDSAGNISKINKTNSNGSGAKKQVKIVTKDKNGQEVTRWEDAAGDSDQDESEDEEEPVEKRTTSDGKVVKKVVKKDKNGREVVEWVPSTDPEDEPGVEESVGGMTIKTTDSGKTFAKVVTKDKNGNEVVNWVEVTQEQVNVLSGNGEGVTEIKGANGQVLKKTITVDENGKEKIEWMPTGPIIKSNASSKKSSAQNTARRQNGTVTLQEEVEEEVVVIDENGNKQIVKKKVIKTRQVKKTVDENGEEVIEEIVIDEATGQKKVVVKKLKDMHNVRLMEPGPVHYDSATEREKITARGSKKITKSRDTQTSFAVEELIQTALQSAGISGTALQEINKALAKQGVDLVKYAEEKKNRKSKGEGEEFEYVNIPGVGKKKVFFTKGDDFEEVEYVTKEGKKIKKKIPKGEKEDYEMNEQGELVYTGKKLQKFRTTNKKYQGHMTDEEEDLHNQSMESVISTDENGKPVKKYRPKRDFEPIGKAKKVTIDEYLREQEELESQRPPATKEEAQARAMYKAMLTKAKGDPKLMNLFKTYLKEKGVEIADEENFIADFDTFNEYMKHFRETHGKCGDNCMHLQRFYARIGYYPIWNNRVPLPMTKPEIANQKARNKVMSTSNSKLPEIKKT